MNKTSPTSAFGPGSHHISLCSLNGREKVDGIRIRITGLVPYYICAEDPALEKRHESE